MKYPRILIALLSFIFSSVGYASTDLESGIYVFPQAAIAQYSNISELESDPLIGLGIGYRFAGPFAVELDFLTGDSKPEQPVRRGQADLSSSIDVDIWSIRSLFYFLESQIGSALSLALVLGCRTSTYPVLGRNPRLTPV